VERKRRSAKKRKKFKKSKRFISGSLELIQLHTSGSASAAAAAARKSNKLLSLRPWTLVRGAPGASVLYVCLQRKRDGREREGRENRKMRK
jgi:hypothetical protein